VRVTGIGPKLPRHGAMWDGGYPVVGRNLEYRWAELPTGGWKIDVIGSRRTTQEEEDGESVSKAGASRPFAGGRAAALGDSPVDCVGWIVLHLPGQGLESRPGGAGDRRSSPRQEALACEGPGVRRLFPRVRVKCSSRLERPLRPTGGRHEFDDNRPLGGGRQPGGLPTPAPGLSPGASVMAAAHAPRTTSSST
jgi:hypothetical protein